MPSQCNQVSSTSLLRDDLHERKEEESSRSVKMRSIRSNEMAIRRMGVDSRKLAKWMRQGACLCSCSFVECKRWCHLFLLLQCLMRFSMEFSTVWIEMEVDVLWGCVFIRGKFWAGDIFFIFELV